MVTRILQLLIILGIAGCCDDAKSPANVPTCAELGCDSALCNSAGRCVCNGAACVMPAPATPDPVCGELAPEASACCAFYLGCATGPQPPECAPPAETCWEFACPLVTGEVAEPGVCS